MVMSMLEIGELVKGIDSEYIPLRKVVKFTKENLKMVRDELAK